MGKLGTPSVHMEVDGENNLARRWLIAKKVSEEIIALGREKEWTFLNRK